MKRFPFILLLLSLALSCVGQKDDAEDDYNQGSVPGTETAGNALVIDFTATWCVNCPRMTSAIEEAMADRPGEIVPLCVHYADPFASDDGLSLVQRFAIQAYPSAIVDMDPTSLTTATSKELLLSRVDERKGRKKAACLLEVSASAPADGELAVSVQVSARADGAYALWVFLVEDGLVAAQTGGSETQVHNHLLRRFLHTGADGDALGTLSKDASASWNASFDNLTLSPAHRIIALVTEADTGLVNTVVSVPVSPAS